MAKEFFSMPELCLCLVSCLDFDTIVALDDSGITPEKCITTKQLFVPYLQEWQNRQNMYGFNDEKIVHRNFGQLQPEEGSFSKYTLIAINYKHT